MATILPLKQFHFFFAIKDCLKVYVDIINVLHFNPSVSQWYSARL